jgi:plastocyanin
MKKLLLLMLAVLIGATVTTAGCVSYGPNPSASSAPQTSTASQNIVSMKNIAFNPSSLTIRRGANVTWTNDDSVTHTVTSNTGIWDSGNLSPGQTYTRQFNDTGTFPYHCKIHGSAMSGTITVTQ